MKRQLKGRTVHTFDLGPEQLQIIEEPHQPVRVLFRGIWLREDAGQRTRPFSTLAATIARRNRL